MQKRELIYDLILILTKAGFDDDSRLDEDYIGYKVDEKRAKAIRDTYNRSGLLEDQWFQDYGLSNVTKIYPSDTSVIDCGCEIGKITLPATVSLLNKLATTHDLGTKIRTVCGKHEYNYMPYDKFMNMLQLDDKENITKKFKHYTKIGNSCYLWPYVEKVRPVLCLEKPLDGFVMETEYVTSGNLVVGTLYEVYDSQVVHNSLGYDVEDTFVAVNANFTGQGKVKLQNQKRAMVDTDEYPMSLTMAEEILIKLLTQEYQLEKQQIADIRNDSKDALHVG